MDRHLMDKRLVGFATTCLNTGAMPEVVFARRDNVVVIHSGPELTIELIQEIRKALDGYEAKLRRESKG